jgi:hypothetical protein
MFTWYRKVTFFMVIIFSMINAKAQVNKFDIISGTLFYSISGGGVLTQETNLTIEGSAVLHFRSWGDEMLLEEGGVLTTSGAIKHKQELRRLEKQTHDKIIHVDYENEQILERHKANSIPNIELETKGLIEQGEKEIAGHRCKIWIGPGVKKCIYKGIVLLHESKVLGISYNKVASETFFDINISKEECAIPDYPVHEFGLITDNIKTKNSAKADNFCKILKETNFALEEEKLTFTKANLEDKERQKFINYIGEDIFKRQKELLPDLLHALKNTRACLQMGDNPFEANACLQEFSRLKEQLGTREDDYIILWDEQLKNELLDKIEDELIYLQSRIPCVNRAQNITDLSRCMK